MNADELGLFEVLLLISIPVLISIFNSLFKSKVRRETSFPKVDPLEPFKNPQKEAFFTWLCEEASRRTQTEVEKDALAMQRLREAFSKALKELESEETAEINLPFFLVRQNGPCHFKIKLSRDDKRIFME